MNLIEKIIGCISDENLPKLAKLLDESPENTKKGLEGIFYTLIAGLIKRTGSSGMTLNMLHKQVKNASNETQIYLEDIEKTLENKAKFAELQKIGEKQISQVFPAFKSPLINMIGNYADIKKTSSSSLTAFGTSLVLDNISKEINNNNLEPNDFAELLLNNHESLFEKVPQDLVELMIPSLGLQELLLPKFATVNKKNVEIKKIPPTTSSPATTSSEPESKSNVSTDNALDSLNGTSPITPKIALIVGSVIIIVGAIVYWYVNKPQTNESEELDTVVAEQISSPAVDSTQNMVDSTAVKEDSVSAIIPVSTGEYSSFGEGLIKYLQTPAEPAGKTFEMNNVKFIGTKIDPESVFVVDELAEILTNNPKMQAVIQGFESSGNKLIATKRALGIKQILLNKGIANARIDAAGIGAGGNSIMIKVVTK